MNEPKRQPTEAQREDFFRRLDAALLPNEGTYSIAKRFGINPRPLRRRRAALLSERQGVYVCDRRSS
jgi:hypothetical protein